MVFLALILNETALIIASCYCYPEIVRILLMQKGIDINVIDVLYRKYS